MKLNAEVNNSSVSSGWRYGQGDEAQQGNHGQTCVGFSSQTYVGLTLNGKCQQKNPYFF